jgi:hypothetical protein
MWGKIPAYGDFVHHNVQAEDIHVWQHWFSSYPLEQVIEQSSIELEGNKTRNKSAGWFYIDTPVPVMKPLTGVWSFVIPKGILKPAPNIPQDSYMVGAMAMSCDKVGRLHPIVIWSSLQSDGLEHLSHAMNWPYWVARLLADHLPSKAQANKINLTDISLQQQLINLWGEASRSFSPRFPLLKFIKHEIPVEGLNRLLGQYPKRPNHPIKHSGEFEFGLRDLPWHNWPHCVNVQVEKDHPQAYFWQQSVAGKYLHCVSVSLTEHGESA